MSRVKTSKEPENKNKDFFEALASLESDRGISTNFMLERIKKAIETACKNSYNNEEVEIEHNSQTGQFNVYLLKTVVDEVVDPDKEILWDNAILIDLRANVGSKVKIKLDTKQFGRVAAQTARNIIRQGIRDSERGQILTEFKSKHQELVSALVEKIDPRTGAASLKIGKAEAVLPKNEQIGTDVIKEGDYIKVYIVDVRENEKGPKAIISRTHPDLVKRLFENEVPEIKNGIVEIKSISREAGSRTKLAVLSNDKNIDSVGACIGTKGARVARIVDELGGEKIDIIEYSEDPTTFISAALSPANVVSVIVPDPEVKVCQVRVPDHQLSLAIGNKGQNARLAAKLTGWKIDIKPESGFFGEEQ